MAEQSALRQYEYGGEGLFGFLMPVRREILSPEQQLVEGYTETRRGPAVEIRTVPAQYGEPERDPTYSPLYRGLKSALHFLYDIGNNREQATETVQTALRGIDQYAKDQYTAAALGGTAYNPETGQVTEFDPTIAMMGGAPAGVQALRAATPGSVVLGMIGSKNAKFNPSQLESIKKLDEAGWDTNQLFLHGTASDFEGQMKPSRLGDLGPGNYLTGSVFDESGNFNQFNFKDTSTTAPEMAGQYAVSRKYSNPDQRLNGAPNTRPMIVKKDLKFYDVTGGMGNDVLVGIPEQVKALKQQGFQGIRSIDPQTGNVIQMNVFDPENIRSAFDYSVPESRSALNDLDMSYEARMQRADQMGMTTEAYSGSTHDIDRFRGDISNPENDWGRGTYASTSIDDVNANYAGVGPDLTNRVEIRAEQIKDNAAFDDDALKSAFESKSQKSWDNMDYEEKLDIAREYAKKELVGDAEGGIVYPLRINTEKYAVIGGPNSTTLDVDLSATKGLDPDSDEYYEALDEASGDLYQRVYDALSNSDAYMMEDSIAAVMSDVSEYLADGQLDLGDLDSSIRKHMTDVYEDATGEYMSPGGVSAQVLENLGYEGVIDNTVNTKFGTGRKHGLSMGGVYPDTQHIITFPGYESRIRSTYAKFDPSKKDSSNILAGIAGGSLVGGSALSGQRQEKNN